jgi:NADH:ubiquinone oxidoreductase subunit H
MIGSLIILIYVIFSVALMTLAERKIMGAMQRRIGPNQVGYLGLLQPFADGIKLILKETILPLESNKNIFLLAPYLIFFLALFNWLIIPLDDNLILSELYGGGILIFITISELSIYGIIFSGWSANSKYPFLGGLRSTAQMISYSVSLSLILLTLIFLNGTVNLIDFYHNQSFISNFLPLLPICFLFIISSIAETNRAPFDLPEAKLLVSFNPTICWKLS